MRTMRRILAVLLTVALPWLIATPAGAAPLREVEYSVSAVRDGRSVSLDRTRRFSRRQRENVIAVSVDERDARGERRTPYVGIGSDGLAETFRDAGLSDEEEAICAFMSLESEDMDGVAPGDRWERQGPAPGGNYIAHYAVLGVGTDGYVEIGVARDVSHGDGSVSQWRGTMLYDVTGVVPAAITLNGEGVALSIRLTGDTFKH